ncbi:MAG: nucleotidyltransferase family protein [Gemmatimonadetes bacterium]|nr:nucleotidyltransferase family protein [Gemmatimonadota bacterium]
MGTDAHLALTTYRLLVVSLDVPAVILVGGIGSRLRPVSGDLPKPMVPIAGRPFLEYLLLFLRAQGVRRVVLCVGYGAERIRSHFGDGKPLGLELVYSVERELLGTGGALRLGAAAIEAETFIALNGDSFADVDLGAMLESHRRRQAGVTVALAAVPDAARFGALDWDPETGRIGAFGEKTRQGPGFVSAGMYVVERTVVDTIPAGVVSLEHQVLPGLTDGRAYGFLTEGLFVDIGLPEEYHRLAAAPQELLVAVQRAAA